MVVLAAVLSILLAGSWVYCLFVVLGARRYLAVVPPAAIKLQPISVLKPLCGEDEGLEENLRSFFAQLYPEFEIVFGVHRIDDAAAALVQRLIDEYKDRISARLVVTGESLIPNGKAHNLNRLVREAKYNLLVMSDSDVRVRPDLLSTIAREFHDQKVGLITCPYRAVAGKSFWSRTEAIGMNTELLGGVLVARMLEGMKFALGPTMAVRRTLLDEIGGFTYLQEFLAEDFIIGQRAAELGYRVVLSSSVIEHRIGTQPMTRNLSHRLRWARSTRRSRPAGYWGQIFTYPLALATVLLAAWPGAWSIVLFTLILRTAAAIATAEFLLHDPLFRKRWWLLPAQDVLGFLVWMGGFVGDTIVWRDRKCTVLRDGRLQVNP